MICTFFGHRDSPSEIYSQLKLEIEKLIQNEGTDLFYVGNHGSFDEMAAKALKELKAEYKHIIYYVVLAYIPMGETITDHPTILPDGIENTPQKFAIDYRNKWMAQKADVAVVYINRSFGGASKYAKKCNRIINLAI